MRCRHCGKRLSLLRQITNSGFCSEQHRKKYLEDQETMGLARLIATNRQINNKPVHKKKSKKVETGQPGVPPLVVRFFPVSPAPQSIVNPFRAPGKPIRQQAPLVFPQAETVLTCCSLRQANAQTSAARPGSSASAIQFANARELYFSPMVELPYSSAKPVLEVDLPDPPVADWVAPPLDLAAISQRPILSLKHFQATPQPIVPRLGITIHDGIGAALSTGVAGNPVYPAPSILAEPLPEKFTGRIELPEDRAGTQPAIVAPEQMLASLDMERSAGFMPNLEAKPPSANGHRHYCHENMEIASSGLRIPSVVHSSSAGLKHARGIELQLHAVSPKEPALQYEPSRLPYPATRAIPEAPLTGTTPLLPRPELVTVPVSCAIIPPKPAVQSIQEHPPGAFLLPPPDLTITEPHLARSSDSAPLQFNASFTPAPPPLGDKPHPQTAQPSEIRLPVTTGHIMTPDLHSTLSEAACYQAASTSGELGTPAIYPEPIPESGTLPPAAGKLILDSSAKHTFDNSYQLDHVASQHRPGFLAVGLDRIVPRDTTSKHQTTLEPELLCPKPLVPASNLHTIPEQEPHPMEPPPRIPMRTRVWGPIVERYKSVPAGVKWAALIVPLATTLLMRLPDALPVHAAEESQEGFRTVLASQWHSFQEGIGDRAAISLTDDFRSGLGEWSGTGDWAKSWSYDQAGFVHPGKLALYTPSVSLSDYHMEFAGQIEQGALSWVCRASDTRNYYAVKLVITEPGPMAEAAIVRYPVIKGKSQRRIRTELPFTLRSERMQNILLDVRGNRYAIYMGDRLVDFWTEDRLKTGGVGFFSERGERTRLRWVSVTHQYDFLGRLCALLAPNSVGER